MANEIRPSSAEKEFLTLAYNRFYDVYDEILSDVFWDRDEQYRFTKIRDAFSIYNELLRYLPIRWVIEFIKKNRPPMEAEIGSDFLTFIRNILVHFPFFGSWKDVWIKKDIINWYKDGRSIDRFLSKYDGHDEVKYRFWEAEKRRMTYIRIQFPKGYNLNQKIFLNDLLSEKDGVKFAVILMKQILDTQVEK
jgi:hypothetical protein